LKQQCSDGGLIAWQPERLVPDHADRIRAALDAIETVEVHRASDRTFLLHLRGKLEVRSTVPLANRDALSRSHTPGVVRVCPAIADEPDDARRLTIKGNPVAAVPDGTAVLGLGDIGPAAALPVMEGKAALLERFAGIDAWGRSASRPSGALDGAGSLRSGLFCGDLRVWHLLAVRLGTPTGRQLEPGGGRRGRSTVRRARAVALPQRSS
jgi:hypothetical protein